MIMTTMNQNNLTHKVLTERMYLHIWMKEKQ